MRRSMLSRASSKSISPSCMSARSCKRWDDWKGLVLPGQFVLDNLRPLMSRVLNSSSTYGEITTKGFRELAKRIELYPGDCFLDMGSGVGRAVVQAALEFGCRSSRGVELSATRHERAQKALLDVINAREALHALMIEGGMGSAKTILLEGVRLVQGTSYCVRDCPPSQCLATYPKCK